MDVKKPFQFFYHIRNNPRPPLTIIIKIAKIFKCQRPILVRRFFAFYIFVDPEIMVLKTISSAAEWLA